ALLIPTIILIISVSLKKKVTGTDFSVETQRRNILAFVFCETVLFFWLLGYYSDRLTYTIGPILILISAININKSQLAGYERKILIGIFMVCHLSTALFTTPHFSEKLFYR